MRTSRTGNSAFTLVELVVVVVIVAVLATMIVPRVRGAASSARLRASARRLLVAAKYARDFAVRHRCECRLVIDTAKQQYALGYQEDAEHDPGKFRALHTGVGRREYLGEGVRFAKVSIDPRPGADVDVERRDCIAFTPLGEADAAVVQITDGRRTYSMTVAPGSGRARLIEGTVNELPNDREDLDE